MPPIPPALVLHRFIVEELKWETPNVYTLVLKPAEGEEMISFLAGQWVYLHWLNEDGTSWGRAAFSIATAPEESGEWFELCVKIKGDFTKRGHDLMPGDVVGIQGPFGVFTLPEGASSLTLLAGGIGITPLRSVLRSLVMRESSIPITLLYSNRDVEEIVYLEEFEQLAKDWPSFKPVFTLTGENVPAKWKYGTGRFNAETIGQNLSDPSEGIFMMCGPDAFMEEMKSLLEAQGVDTKTQVKRESFG